MNAPPDPPTPAAANFPAHVAEFAAAMLYNLPTGFRWEPETRDKEKTTMSKILYDSGPMKAEGPRGRFIVTQTAAGVTVKYDSLYTDTRDNQTHFFKHGNYPTLPAKWDSPINEHKTTAAAAWLHELKGMHTPDRISK